MDNVERMSERDGGGVFEGPIIYADGRTLIDVSIYPNDSVN